MALIQFGYRVFETFSSPVQSKQDNPELELPKLRREILWVPHFLSSLLFISIVVFFWLFVCSSYLFVVFLQL